MLFMKPETRPGGGGGGDKRSTDFSSVSCNKRVQNRFC